MSALHLQVLEANLSQSDQAGKNQAKRLGRGLSALLGTPVSIRVPKGTGVVAAKGEELLPPPYVSTSMQIPVSKVGTTTELAPDSIDLVRQALAAHDSSVPTVTKSDGGGAHPGYELREIPLEQIVPNPRQPRTDFDHQSIESLAASIRQAGVMQPIMVRRTRNGFELVAGERRWRAAKLVGLTAIPAIVRELDDEASAELAIIENVHREDLNPMDRALALRRLAVDFQLTHQDVADRVGLDRASVTNLLRLSELDPATADLVRRGAISQSHGKALLGIADLDRRLELAKRAAGASWSVRELERRVQQANDAKQVAANTSVGPASEPSPRTANVADLERKLAEHLGTRVALQLGRKKGSGRLIVQFYSFDQFDGLMSRFGFNADR